MGLFDSQADSAPGDLAGRLATVEDSHMEKRRLPDSTKVSLLLQSLDYAFDRPGWQGPNLARSVRGVSAQRAAQSTGGRRSIWEQILHAAYWKQRVINLLIGTQPFPRKGSNWPRLPPEKNERNWKADVKLLHEIHVKLRAAVAGIDPKKLNGKTTRLILGAAAHDVYHTGQIRLLRRMVGLARKK